MYLIRRVYKVKPRTQRQAEDLITRIGNAYVEAGQRTPIRVYHSGGTVPGPMNTVYMDWTEEKLESPYRPGLVNLEAADKLSVELRDIVEESYIEFYEMYSPS